MQKYLTTVFVLFFFVSVAYGVPDTLKVKISDSVVLTKEQLAPKENVHIYFRDRVQSNHFKDVLPIFTLLLGIFINRIWDKFEKKRQSKRHAQRWRDELALLAAPLEVQIEACNKFLVELKESNIELPTLTTHFSLQCLAFDVLDKSELIRYLEIYRGDYETAVKIASTINILILALKNNRKILDEKIQDFITGVSSYGLDLRNGLHDFGQNLQNYQIERERAKDDQKNPHVIALRLLYKEYIELYQKHCFYDIDKLEKEFVPKYFIIGDNLRLDSRLAPITETVQSIFTAIQNLRNNRLYLQNNIEGVIKRYVESSSSLDNILKEL